MQGTLHVAAAHGVGTCLGGMLERHSVGGACDECVVVHGAHGPEVHGGAWCGLMHVVETV
jgi:hypothetical protein